MSDYEKWLLMLYRLPTSTGGARVSLWRQLKKTGALPFKTSATLLPESADHYERLQWLAQQVRDGGGEATLIRVTEIEGLSRSDIVQLFNDARASEYEGLAAQLKDLIATNKKKTGETFSSDLEKLLKTFEEIRKVDFFGCPRAQDVQMLLERAFNLGGKNPKTTPKLSAKKYLGKMWLTRPKPQIDRVGSAWLIRRFIDPKATFVFDTDPKAHPEAIPYDMYEVEFSHHGDDCTFETLVKRFGLTDKAVLKMAEMVHDTDLEDGKFQTVDCLGIARILKGWAKAGCSDVELLRKGTDCFEALYQTLKD